MEARAEAAAVQGRRRSGYVLAGAGGLLTSLFLGWLLGERLRPRAAGALSGLAGPLVGRALLLRAGARAPAAVEGGTSGAQAAGDAREVPRRGPSGRERTGGAGRAAQPHSQPSRAGVEPRSHHL